MTGSVPGIEVIQAAAARAGIDISDSIAKAQQIMGADPASIRAGSAKLRNTATGLDSTGQDMQRTGTQLLSNWNGASADAFAAQHATVVGQAGSHRDAANGLADQLDVTATGFENSQRAVLAATGVAATAIGAQQAAK
jgi:WXG100 family type VII secretion target